MFQLSYEDFLQLLDSKNIPYEMDVIPHQDNWDYKKRKYVPGSEKISVQWEIGGVSGGSCWDDSDPQPYSSNNPPLELQALDDILAIICPDILFLQYKVLVNKLVKTSSNTEYEWYGNCTEYMSKTVKLKDLYDFLVNAGYILVPPA